MTLEVSMQGTPCIQWAIWIPLRDGVRLHATVYLPDQLMEPTSVILTITPYVAQTFHEHGLYFARHGYPFVVVDCRGRGNSDGEFLPFLREAEDGFDVIEWLSAQPYCNGKVVTWGGSYGGYNQWMMAKERPPHLASIVPVAAARLGVDIWMRSNVFYPYVMRWLVLTAGRALQDKVFWGEEAFWLGAFRRWFESGAAFSELDTMLGYPCPYFQEMISHATCDAYWDRHSPTEEQYAQVTIPILTVTGIYDSDQPGALAHYRSHLQRSPQETGAQHYLVIGPWHHAGTRIPQKCFAGMEFGEASMLDIQWLHVQWYDWITRGGPRPEFLRKRVAYYVTGAERWRYADTLTAVTARHQPLYLNSTGTASRLFHGGTLDPAPGSGPPDQYAYDPRDTSIAAIEAQSRDPVCLRPTFPTENLRDQGLVYAMDGKQLVYHGEPFERDVEVTGAFRLQAWLAIDQPDTDFLVCIYEIDATGGSVLLTSDMMRARYRQSVRQEALITTRDPLRYDFSGFTFTSRVLKTGSRLRLTIGPINSMHFQRNCNSGGVVAHETIGDARSVNVTLFHDADHPSALFVPLGQSGVEDV